MYYWVTLTLSTGSAVSSVVHAETLSRGMDAMKPSVTDHVTGLAIRSLTLDEFQHSLVRVDDLSDVFPRLAPGGSGYHFQSAYYFETMDGGAYSLVIGSEEHVGWFGTTVRRLYEFLCKEGVL